MSIAQSMLAEFETQAPVTRRFIERLPQDKLTWKPHEKSMTAGQLAYHLATVPAGVLKFVSANPQQAPTNGFPQPATLKEILGTYEQTISAVRTTLPALPDSYMQETWRLFKGDLELLAIPRGQFLRDVMLSHWYQHRGQFSVYLRILGVPVPASWGPSADEPPLSLQRAQSA